MVITKRVNHIISSVGNWISCRHSYNSRLIFWVFIIRIHFINIFNAQSHSIINKVTKTFRWVNINHRFIINAQRHIIYIINNIFLRSNFTTNSRALIPRAWNWRITIYRLIKTRTIFGQVFITQWTQITWESVIYTW